MRISRRTFTVLALAPPVVPSLRAHAQDSTVTTTPPRGGLGLTTAEWIELWGEPSDAPEFKYWKFEQDMGGHQVRFLYFEEESKIGDIEIHFPGGPIPLELAEITTERYYPEDSVFVEEYPLPLGPGIVQRYNSPWLLEQFPITDEPITGNMFTGGDPGDFVAIYQSNEATGDVLQVLLALGNNP